MEFLSPRSRACESSPPCAPGTGCRATRAEKGDRLNAKVTLCRTPSQRRASYGRRGDAESPAMPHCHATTTGQDKSPFRSSDRGSAGVPQGGGGDAREPDEGSIARGGWSIGALRDCVAGSGHCARRAVPGEPCRRPGPSRRASSLRGKWCCWTGLNCRPHHYQWCALPLSYSSLRRLRAEHTQPTGQGQAAPRPKLRISAAHARGGGASALSAPPSPVLPGPFP